VKKNIIKLIFGILLISVVFILIFVCYTKFFNKEDVTLSEEKKVVKEITEYGYKLEDDETTLYKETFEELVNILENDEVDYENYANVIAKLFVIDFYDLDNKITKNDVGGLQFIYSTRVENFNLNAKNTIYKTIENNIYKKRTQKLPKVTEVTINSTEKTTFKFRNESKEAYLVKLTITYAEDLGYQSEVSVTLIHEDKKLSIAEVK